MSCNTSEARQAWVVILLAYLEPFLLLLLFPLFRDDVVMSCDSSPAYLKGETAN